VTSSPSESAGVGSSSGRPRRSGRRGLLAAVVVGTAIAVGAGIVVTDPFAAGTEGASSEATTSTGLAQVTKGTLSARTLENGTLGYAGNYQVVGRAGGTVTQVPSVGQVIRQGAVLYRVDGKPVILLQGASAPVYRDLYWGMEGADVRQLNAALVKLGYATADELDPKSDYFGRQTYNALRELQDAVGQDDTGKLELGQAVFLPTEQLRITKVNAVTGASVAVGTTVLQASSTQRQVTVALNAGRQSEVAIGDKVTISLPNGKTTPGVVSEVGKVATKADDKTTIDVLIKPSKPTETGQLDQAPVQVSIVTDTAQNVLSVPVNALLALAGGGYAVEVVGADGARSLVPVKPGLFDDSAGKIAVTATGLAAGQNIVVPAS
jgi:hypothetical protein